MTISGYDPEDVDEALEQRIEERDPGEFLTDEQIREWEDGESLLELLDDDDIERLLESSPVEQE